MTDEDVSLELHPVHRALSRANLLFGADRELVLIAGLVAVILIFVVITPLSAALGFVVWTLIVAVLRRLAKSDPMMRRVYLRHISYRPSYRATSSPWGRRRGALPWSV